MVDHAEALRDRIARFAVDVLKFVRRAPRDCSADVVCRQLARSASGASANYRSACAARSRPEFIAKLGIAVEEADETVHWLWMAGELELGPKDRLSDLLGEARALRAILWASLKTARQNWQAAEGGVRRRRTP